MGKWKHGLFGCFENMETCLIGSFVPCIYGYQVSKAVGLQPVMNVAHCVCYPLTLPLLRKEVRQKKSIDGGIIEDLAFGCCLSCCTTIQLKREFD